MSWSGWFVLLAFITPCWVKYDDSDLLITILLLMAAVICLAGGV